jgi:hypothetical protein
MQFTYQEVIMNTVRYSMPLCAAITLVCLAGCASTEQDQAEQNKQLSYVTPVGVGGWSVSCPLQTVTIIDVNISVFYKPDGSAKTVNEFCRDFDSGSRILRRQ